MHQRRDFLKKALVATSVAATAGVAAACSEQAAETGGGPAISTKKFQWKCVTTWPPNFPVVGESINAMAKDLEVLSGGRLKLQVYGSGELIPGLEAFDAVTSGTIEMAHGAAYYWAGKAAATQFFAAIPFGMTPQQINAWFYYGDGLKLWREIYAPFNLVPFPCGNTGVQMGGWFNREIKSVGDLKGLKMRIPGLGGQVISRLGGSAVTMAGGEIYTNLERGVIDATEWIGPYHDYTMGFHRIAKYYYYPGWHEPGTALEMFVNKSAFESLPADLQLLVETVAMKYNLLMLAEFEAKNNLYLKKIQQESSAQLLPFPDEVLRKLKEVSQEVVNEIITKDAASKKVYESYMAFKAEIQQWGRASELAINPYL